MKTIDDICGKPHGTFKKFVECQKEEMRRNEFERKERIRQFRTK